MPRSRDCQSPRPESTVVPAPPRQGLSLPALAALPSDIPLIYGMARLDASGRITDHTVLTALAWHRGRRFAATPATTSTLIMTPDPLGPISVNAAGYLTVPAAQRRWCALSSGDRVLLIADAEHQLLILHGPAALAAMVARYHSWQTGGDDELPNEAQRR